MYRIGIITSDFTHDHASLELLSAANALAFGGIIDPMAFEMRVNGEISLTAGAEPLAAYDGFIIRGFNRDGDSDYQYEILELLQRAGKFVVNSPAALSIAESKAQTTFLLRDAGLPVPRTIVTQSLECARSELSRYGKAVLKPLYGSHGYDMEIVSLCDSQEILPRFFKKHKVIYMQEFVPSGGMDIRAFVVGDEVRASVYRIACKGNWRANVAQGSTCMPCDLSMKLRDICVEATKVSGLEYTGIDVIEGPDGPVVLEVNGAPSWQGLREVTGRDVARDVVTHVLHLLEEGRPVRQPAGF